MIPVVVWWAHQGLNLGASDYESVTTGAGCSALIASHQFEKDLRVGM